MGKNIKARNQIHKTKKELRVEIQNKRKQLTKEEIKVFSSQICNALCQHEIYKNSTSVLIYLPIDNEVETNNIIEQMQIDNKKIFAPRVLDFDKGEMEFYQIKKGTEYIVSDKDILEPIPSDFMYMQTENTLCITPGLVFDKNKNRIGYGKGFYDRFFERVSCAKIGLCYDFQIVEQVPISVNDKKMDVIISERRII